MDTTPAIVGLPWYEEASYQAVTALMHDPDKLFAIYADWHRAAQRTEDQVRGNGQTAIRVTLDLVQFPAWCKARRLRIDAQARMDYAAFIAVQQYRAGQEGARH